MRKPPLSTLLLLAGLSLLAPPLAAQAPPASAPATLGHDPASPLGRALLALDPEVFRQELIWWADEARDGRETGTPAADEVAARAAVQLQELGLKPLGDKDRKTGKPDFFQDFPVESSRLRHVTAKEAAFRLGNRQLGLGEEWTVLSGSRPAKVKGAGLVFLGYGLKDELFAAAELKGKVAVVWEGEPGKALDMGRDPRASWMPAFRDRVRRAAEFGAEALILVPSPGTARPLFLIRQDLVGGARKAVPVVQLAAEAAGRLLGRLRRPDEAEKVPQAIPGLTVDIVYTATEPRQGRNVVALWPGSDPRLSREHVVIGAHRDHLGIGGFGSLKPNRFGEVHHGADDNASGSVGVLQLARAMSHAGFHPKRSVIFMLFDGEELGLLGSRHWVANPTAPLESVVAMINLDMIGRSKEGSCDLIGTTSSPAWGELLEGLKPRSPVAFRDVGGGFGGSDHMSFQMRRIPAVFFFTGMHQEYHSPDDTADRCNCEGAVEILRFALALAAQVADRPERLPFQSLAPARPGAADRVQLGMVPQQTAEGVKIHEIVADSPAAKAGLQAGDVLVALDGRKVRTVSDLFRALRRKKKGDKVAITWRRDGQEQSREVEI